jgi:transketolase
MEHLPLVPELMPPSAMAYKDLDYLCVNALRFMSVDTVQKAGSGHPGLPLGAASMAFALWDRFLKFGSKDSQKHHGINAT